MIKVDYTEINHNIFHDLSVLKKYPGMCFRGERTYIAFETYLNGYLRGLGDCSGVVLGKIRLWFQEKVNQNSSCFFTAHVEHYYNDRSEEERIHLLIDLVEEFFQENPKWYL